ncbi:MAG: SurA N-terminal domain-containing protein [Spirochaetales bacterium]|nr:SurA N-terminal domain-containing protein [Spirochaetales bacterium]
MKRIIPLYLILFPAALLFGQDYLSRIQLDDEELQKEWERYLIQGQLQNQEYSEEEKNALRENVKEGMIMRKLLLSLADYRGITIDADELNALEAATRGDYPEEEWKALLETQLHTEESYRRTLEESLLIEKVLQTEILDKIVITDEEVLAYYETHEEDFSSDYGLIPFSDVKKLIREGLKARKGQEETIRFMEDLYSRAMFVEE